MPVFGSIGVDHHLPLDARARVEPHWTGARRRAPWLHRSPVEQPRGAGRYAAPAPLGGLGVPERWVPGAANLGPKQ